MTQSPSAVPSKVTTFSTRGSSPLLARSLAICVVVLGEDDLRLGVAEDVGRRPRRSWSGTPWWSRRRRHDREVGQDPLVARARGDRDALLGLDAERDQSGGPSI